MALTWHVYVDWDGDGTLESDEAARVSSLYTRRGRSYYLRADGGGLQNVDVGEATLILDNEDQRFNPYNSSSPIYPNVLPSRFVQITVETGTATRYVFTGEIADLKPIDDDGKRVQMWLVDGLQMLRDQKVTIGLNESISIDKAIGKVLDAVNWPAVWGRSLEVSPDYIFYWWADSEAALDVIQAIVNVGISYFYVGADGKATFLDRYLSGSAKISLTDGNTLKKVDVTQPWDAVKNKITVHSYPRALQARTALWQLTGTTAIKAGETLTLWATFVYGGETVPAKNVVAPAAYTDFKLNSSAAGTGTNLTGSCAVTATVFAQSAKLEVTNSAAVTGYLTLMQIRGEPISAPSPVVVVSEDTSSQAQYRTRELVVDSPWQQDPNRATDFAAYLKTLLASPVKFPRVRLQHQPALQFEVDLFELVDYDSDHLGIDDVFAVGMIEHNWLHETGQDVLTTLRLEPYAELSATAWVFSTQIGTSSYFAF